MRSQLLLTYDFPPMGGGISRWMGELARRYPAGSLVVSTGQYGNGSAEEVFPNRVDRLSVVSDRLRTVQGTVLWSRRVAFLVRSQVVEFIWCGNLKPAGYPALWTKYRAQIPYGVLLHGGDLLILRQQIRRSAVKRRTAMMLLGSAALLVTNSQWTADLCRTLLEEAGIGHASGRVRSVPLGTDPQFFQPRAVSSERTRYGLVGGRWLLSVARLTRHKGIDLGLAAVARLQGRYPTLGYIVVGSGEELPALQRQARELGVADRVRFLTDVPDRELPAIYNCAEIYLGLSRLLDQRVEGFGISLVEAGACAVAVVAGRTGGIPETVHDEETGLLVNPEDSSQVDAAIVRLLDDRTLAQRLGSAARQRVERYYNWDRVAGDIARLGHEYGRSGS